MNALLVMAVSFTERLGKTRLNGNKRTSSSYDNSRSPRGFDVELNGNQKLEILPC